MRRARAWVVVVCWAGLALGCDEFASSEPPSGASGFAVAGRGGGGVAPALPGATVQPPTVPQMTPPPVAGSSGPQAPTTCEGVALQNGRGLNNRTCADCLCAINPMATVACTRDCWTLAFCVAASGCASADVDCIANGCNPDADGEGFAVSASAAANVPFEKCLPECFGDRDTRPAQVACAALRADRPGAQVGESIALTWDAAIGAGEYSIALTPWANVASLHEVDEQTLVRCDAPGRVSVELESDRCDQPLAPLELECTARPDLECCPIDALAESGAACSELGGSPPCHVGCSCLRDGGVFYTELDARGCLEWVLRPALDSAEHLVCLDPEGNPSPDPRRSP